MEQQTPAVRFAAGTDDLLEGWLVPYGGSFNGRDSYGTYATPQTRFCLDLFPAGSRPLMYHHGLDKDIGPDPVGRIRSLEAREHGIWMQAQLDLHNQYVREIRELVDKGALGLSSGALAHLVEIDARSGAWIQWPIAEGSLTPMPANLLATIDVPTFKSHVRSAGIELPQPLVEQLERGGPALDDRPPRRRVDAALDAAGPWAAVRTQRTFDALDAGQKMQLYYDVALERDQAGLDALRAVWSTAFVNDLPDSSFAYIEPGGSKDSDGKTMPRSLRHLPYKDSSGKPDAAHVRNALARLSQTQIPDAAKAKARRKLVAAAKELGIEVSDENEGGRSAASSPQPRAPLASYEGSYEDLQDALRSALNPAGPWSQGYTSLLQTYADSCLCRYDPADSDEGPAYYRVAYVLDDEGQPCLGERTALSGQQSGAADVVRAAIAPFTVESSYLHRQILAWHENAKALVARRAAEERPPSPANCRALAEVRSALLDVASSLHDILVASEERRAQQSRTAYLCDPAVRKRELELLQWALDALPPEPEPAPQSA